MQCQTIQSSVVCWTFQSLPWQLLLMLLSPLASSLPSQASRRNVASSVGVSFLLPFPIRMKAPFALPMRTKWLNFLCSNLSLEFNLTSRWKSSPKNGAPWRIPGMDWDLRRGPCSNSPRFPMRTKLPLFSNRSNISDASWRLLNRSGPPDGEASASPSESATSSLLTDEIGSEEASMPPEWSASASEMNLMQEPRQLFAPSSLSPGEMFFQQMLRQRDSGSDDMKYFWETQPFASISSTMMNLSEDIVKAQVIKTETIHEINVLLLTNKHWKLARMNKWLAKQFSTSLFIYLSVYSRQSWGRGLGGRDTQDLVMEVVEGRGLVGMFMKCYYILVNKF